MIKINGVQIVTPSDFSVGVMDISKAERNANGTMILETITTKRKLEMSWKYLSNSQLSTLFNSITSTFFTVSYPDPLTGATRSGTFYKGDRKSGGMYYNNGAMSWKDISVNFIER
jgi:hypothetical protein